jgi:dihydrofolate reductase
LSNISIIVAIDNNGLIGKNNHLPWQIKEDLLHFKNTTLGHPIVMGKKTWLSISKPLEGRTNIILTNDKTLIIPGCIIYNNIKHILADFTNEELFVIGGATTFNDFLPYTGRIYLTKIHATFEGDTYFPELNWNLWEMVHFENILSDTGYEISFERWEKKQASV